MTEDWHAWPDEYADPRTGLAGRLAIVQDRVRAALDALPPGPLRAISLCAGQGHDLIGPLSGHPRRGEVTARLVELDPRNAAVASRLAADADIETTTGYCTRLCASGGIVIWTRSRWEPDLSPRVCDWFEERGFERVWLSDASDPGFRHRVGVHRFTGTPAPLEPDAVMFTFVGHDVRHGPPRTR